MPPLRTRSGRRSWTAADRGMLHLVKLVLAPGWSAEGSAARLAEEVMDPRVLEQMSKRVQAALVERPSDVGMRAHRTLSVALARSRAA